MAMRKVCALVLLVALVALAAGQDVGQLLMNDYVVDRQIGCVLNRNRCDLIGRQIKATLPEALNNNCRRCSPRLAENARKLITFMQTSRPKEWREIVELYGKRTF